MSGHTVPRKIYYQVFGGLILLTALTTYAATVNLDKLTGVTSIPLNTVVALAIAVCKASLVVLFFMHIRWSSHLVRIVVFAGIFWLAILISLTASDIFTRNWTPVAQSWHASQTLPYR
jgi:cytochrome c oxidase subunit IV